MEKRNLTQTKIDTIVQILNTQYPQPKTELENWSTPFEFLVCVILSAQATDKGVNKVTKALFEAFPTINSFAKASPEQLKSYIKSINYYKTKAKRINEAAKFVMEEFQSTLPQDIDQLTKIPGIGRKSANVILHEAMSLSQGIVVDTHVTRVAYRLGLTSYDNQKDAEKIEAELKKKIPKANWQDFSGAMVLHGRYVCKAKSPDCAGCMLREVCPSADKFGK